MIVKQRKIELEKMIGRSVFVFFESVFVDATEVMKCVDKFDSKVVVEFLCFELIVISEELGLCTIVFAKISFIDLEVTIVRCVIIPEIFTIPKY